MTFKLLIADDAADVADVIAFGARMVWPDCHVTIAADGERAMKAFAANPPDLVVLDVSMPAPDGFEVCRRIRTASQVPIMMLTVHDATLDKVRALDLGADDYLTKPFDHLELLARMRALLRRANSASVSISTRYTVDDIAVDDVTREVRIHDTLIPLTSTEYRLLEVLIQHAGAVVTRHVLLEKVWGPEYVHDTHYLKVFVRRLRQKLGDDADQPRYIQTEWGIGYRFLGPRLW
ncbi:MAG: response regulator transcription factor [Roseiflexaceae bacterium]